MIKKESTSKESSIISVNRRGFEWNTHFHAHHCRMVWIRGRTDHWRRWQHAFSMPNISLLLFGLELLTMLHICRIECLINQWLGPLHSKHCMGISPMSLIWEFLVPKLGPEYHLTRGRPSKPKIAHAFCWDMEKMQNLKNWWRLQLGYGSLKGVFNSKKISRMTQHHQQHRKV